MAGAPTLDDVAALVGVSARTVSRVLRHEGGYSDATAARVRDAVRQLRYSPNHLARSLRSHHTDTIGIIGPGDSDPAFGAVADAVQLEARSVGLTALCASAFGDPSTQRRLLDLFRSVDLGGAIVCPVPDTFDDIAHHAATGLSIVVVGVDWAAPGVASVGVDTRSDEGAIARAALGALRRLMAEPNADVRSRRVDTRPGTDT